MRARLKRALHGIPYALARSATLDAVFRGALNRWRHWPLSHAFATWRRYTDDRLVMALNYEVSESLFVECEKPRARCNPRISHKLLST